MRKILLFFCAVSFCSNVYGGVETAVLNERHFHAPIKHTPSPSIHSVERSLSDEEPADFSPPRPKAEYLGADSTDEEKSSSDEDSRESSDKENNSSDEDHTPPVFHNLSPPKLRGILKKRVEEASDKRDEGASQPPVLRVRQKNSTLQATPLLSKVSQEEQEMFKFLKRNLHEQEFLHFSNAVKILSSPDGKENRFYARAKATAELLYNRATLRSLEAMSNYALKGGVASSCIVQ